MLGNKKIQIKRPSKGERIKGRWQDGASTAFEITGSIQPTMGDKLQTLLEGKRVQSIYEIITLSELKATDPKTETTGDIAVINGLDYEIIQVMPWQNGILPHYSCIALREKEGN
jgi:hypothetical protein